MDLFRAKNGDRESFGMDSLALDIIRSRDHGLTSYVHYLNACRKAAASGHETTSVTTWEELQSQFSAKVVKLSLMQEFIRLLVILLLINNYFKDFELLRKIYHHVEDIDLVVGGIAELSESDSLVGPTFSCIIGESFV